MYKRQTHRKRLFIVAQRGNHNQCVINPTHIGKALTVGKILFTNKTLKHIRGAIVEGDILDKVKMRMRTPERFKQLHPNIFSGSYKLIKIDRPMGTLTTAFTNPGSGAYTLLADGVYSVLSIKQASLLQGFNNKHVFKGTKKQQEKMIGNSICPCVSRAIAYTLKKS